MEYREIIEQITFETGVSRREVARILQAFARVFQGAMLAGDTVTVRNIGRFKRGAIAPGQRCTPTGQKIRRVLNAVHFRPSKALREKMRRHDYGR